MTAAWTSVLLIRRMKFARRHAIRARWTLDLNFPIRIMAFGTYVIIALRSAPIKKALRCDILLTRSCFSLSLISVTSPSSPVPDITIATGRLNDHRFYLLMIDQNGISAATVFVLIFGTQSVRFLLIAVQLYLLTTMSPPRIFGVCLPSGNLIRIPHAT